MSNRLLNIAWLVSLPAPTKLLLIALADRADDGGKSWPSREMLCAQTGLSPASVSQHVQALIANGLLTQQRRRQRSAEYALDERALILASEGAKVAAVASIEPKMSSSKTSTSYTSTNKMSTSVDQDVQLLDIPKENPHRTLSSTSSKRASKRSRVTGDEEFDAFWAAYPRKVDKQDALRAYTKAIKITEPARLLSAIKAHASYWTKAGRDSENIPHATTWLNKRRWEDELGPQHVPRGDPVEWLRDQWKAGRVAEIHQHYRSGYTQPDNPGLDADAYAEDVLKPHNRHWITEHRDRILAQLTSEAS